MYISAHEANNEYYYPGGTAWALGWTSQQLVTTAIVQATGGTYEVRAPEESQEPEIKPEPEESQETV